VDVLLSFAAALVAWRLAALLVRRYRERREDAFAAWAAALGAYAVACAALAWSAADAWSSASFRVYYLFGGLLSAPLLGCGSLLRGGYRWARPLALVYAGLAVGVALAMPVHGSFAGHAIPKAQDHVDTLARVVAIVANSLGTLAVLVVAVRSWRRRPVGNALILGGVGVAAVGSALSGLGVVGTAAFTLVGALLLYAGFVARR
jgi:hypothetical protein